MNALLIPKDLKEFAESQEDFVKRALYLGLSPMMIRRYVLDESEASRVRKELIIGDADALGYDPEAVEFKQL